MGGPAVSDELKPNDAKPVPYPTRSIVLSGPIRIEPGGIGLDHDGAVRLARRQGVLVGVVGYDGVIIPEASR
jgi:hypothetical protein